MSSVPGAQSRPVLTDLFDLTGRSALIPGASGAFGRAAALVLAGAGAHITLAAANSDALTELAHEIESSGGQAEIIVRRPESPDDAEAMVQIYDEWFALYGLRGGTGGYR